MSLIKSNKSTTTVKSDLTLFETYYFMKISDVEAAESGWS
jgi:hypothetical protein